MTGRDALALGDRVSVPSASGRSVVCGTVELIEPGRSSWPDAPDEVTAVHWRDDWGHLWTHAADEVTRLDQGRPTGAAWG